MEQSSFGSARHAAAPVDQDRPAGWYADPQNPQQKRYFDGQSWTGTRSAPVRHHASQPTSSSRSKGLTVLIAVLALLIAVPAVYVGRGFVDSWLHPSRPPQVEVPRPPGFKDGTQSAWGRWTHGREGQKYANFSRDLEAVMAPLAASTGPADVINGFYQLRQVAHRGLRLPTSPSRDFNVAWDRAMNQLIDGSDCLQMDPACRETFKTAGRSFDAAADMFNRSDTAWKISSRIDS